MFEHGDVHEATCGSYTCATSGYVKKTGVSATTNPTESKCCKAEFCKQHSNGDQCAIGLEGEGVELFRCLNCFSHHHERNARLPTNTFSEVEYLV